MNCWPCPESDARSFAGRPVWSRDFAGEAIVMRCSTTCWGCRAKSARRWRGFIIAGEDGIALAVSEGVADAERYSAIAPKLFRRTRRYLKQLSGSAVNALYLPETTPPLLVLMMPFCHVVATLRPDIENSDALRKAPRIVEEINWLLSRRAAVRSQA